MPKRKSDKDKNDYDYLLKKIKHLEKKVRSSDCRRKRDSSNSLSDAEQAANNRTDNDLMKVWALPDEEVNEAASAAQYSDYSEPDQTDSGSPTPSSKEGAPPVAAQRMGAAAAPIIDPPAAPAPPIVDPQSVLVGVIADQPTTADPPAPETEEALDADLLEILGIDPTVVKQYGKDIQKDVSIRLEYCATNGLTKELRKEFKDRYLTPDNCKLIDPPEINAEIKAAVSDIVYKRDKAIENKQKQLTSAISCLGEAITLLMSNKDKNTPLLKLLIDSARILCDCQHADTITRRNFLLNAMKKEMKDQLQNTKIDKFLFSENLADTIKSAKAISKSGADLKVPAPKAPTKKPTSHTSKNLNWKPGPARRQPGPSRTKEPATTSTRKPPSNTSRTSQHQHQRSSLRHR